MKKHWYLIVPALLLLSPVLMVLYISATYGYTLPDSIAVFMAIGKSDTKFRLGNYSESRFHRVHEGDSGKDVFDLLGIPLERHNNDTEWCYSLPVGGAKFYHERTFIMDHGKVKSIICRFHTPETTE